MYRVLIIETGDYVYSYKNDKFVLYTLQEIKNKEHPLSSFNIVESLTREEIKFIVTRGSYVFIHNIKINLRDSPEVYEIVEVPNV